MKEILVLGAGKIGALIAGLLAESGSYRVQLADAEPGVAKSVATAHRLDTITAFDFKRLFSKIEHNNSNFTAII